MISATEPDWAREIPANSPSKKLLKALRDYQKYCSKGPAFFLLKVLAVLRHRTWSIITGADIPINCKIGGGLLLPHPNGVVIHSDAEVGPNCLIFQQVTIGARGEFIPKIGGHVDIGAGAKVLGKIKVGDHAKIGANAVVLDTVPVGATAVGIPAKIIDN
ncbi:MAG: serine O-acetyltransferase [bacterium]